MPRYTASRQKACASCSVAKAKCDRKPGQCARCALRGLSCAYPSERQPERETTDDHASIICDVVATAHISPPTRSCPPAVGDSYPTPDAGSPHVADPSCAVSFRSSKELHCPIDADAIQNRWLKVYLATPGQVQKNYSVGTTVFIYRILNSYIGTMIRGHGVPPFIHASHLEAIRSMHVLSICLTLLRICDKPLPGSEHVIVDTVQREMNKLIHEHSTYTDAERFAAFQAHLVYCMVLFFRFSESSRHIRRQSMVDLQTLACASSRDGLVCIAAEASVSPQWESWVIAEAKRRTLFTMYIFDSLLSAEEGAPSFIGTELEGLPGPASRQLWTAPTYKDWKAALDAHRTEWIEDFCVDELWPTPTDFDQSQILMRRRRVDQWLEDVDEYGTMLYAVTCTTYGV